MSKHSAVRLGYYEDDFIGLFVDREVRRSPLLNRGYYARVAAVERTIEVFLAGVGERGSQVVSLGAGCDTTFFRLAARQAAPSLYVEVDTPEVVKRKARIIRAHPGLRAAVGPIAESEEGQATAAGAAAGATLLATPSYRLAPADLRDVGALAEVLLGRCGLDPAVPTLFLSECVLVYMGPTHSAAALRWAAETFADGGFFLYEQIRPNDAFGQTMVANLNRRGCGLLGLCAYPELADQQARFTGLGWDRACARDLNQIYRTCLDKDELKRIERIEIFDEFEEWHLMNAHYCVVLAENGTVDLSAVEVS